LRKKLLLFFLILKAKEEKYMIRSLANIMGPDPGGLGNI